LYATYADDTFASSLLEQSTLPAIVWGTNDYDTGSIAGAQQLGYVLTETGRYYNLVFGNVDDKRALDEILLTARVAAAKRRISSSRIGVVGFPHIKGQTQAAFDEIELREKMGARIVSIGLHHLTTAMSKFGDQEIRQAWKRISEGIRAISVNDDQIREGVAAYLAMKQIVREHRLDAIAVEDWNELIGLPNLGFSLLNEEGVPAGCEADVHATLVLYLLSLLTGKPAFHGDFLGILEDQDALLVAHYGAGAPSLAVSRDRISLQPDRASHRGVSVVYQVRPGPITIASLTGRRGTYRMLIAAAESINAREVFHGGVVANVKFRANHQEFLRKARGMSHHWILGLGDVSRELVEFCEMTEIRSVVA
jgi:L-arabinose isomerase